VADHFGHGRQRSDVHRTTPRPGEDHHCRSEFQRRRKRRQRSGDSDRAVSWSRDMNKSGSDIDDALNSLRTLFLSSLAILALWFLAWPAAVLKLQQFDQARDLEAWVLLKEL